ncbi:hypothetical protein R6Q59_013296 [Mikania micrantha]
MVYGLGFDVPGLRSNLIIKQNRWGRIETRETKVQKIISIVSKGILLRWTAEISLYFSVSGFVIPNKNSPDCSPETSAITVSNNRVEFWSRFLNSSDDKGAGGINSTSSLLISR